MILTPLPCAIQRPMPARICWTELIRSTPCSRLKLTLPVASHVSTHDRQKQKIKYRLPHVLNHVLQMLADLPPCVDVYQSNHCKNTSQIQQSYISAYCGRLEAYLRTAHCCRVLRASSICDQARRSITFTSVCSDCQLMFTTILCFACGRCFDRIDETSSTRLLFDDSIRGSRRRRRRRRVFEEQIVGFAPCRGIERGRLALARIQVASQAETRR